MFDMFCYLSVGVARACLGSTSVDSSSTINPLTIGISQKNIQQTIINEWLTNGVFQYYTKSDITVR